MILFILLCIVLTACAAHGATPPEKRRLFPYYED